MPYVLVIIPVIPIYCSLSSKLAFVTYPVYCIPCWLLSIWVYFRVS